MNYSSYNAYLLHLLGRAPNAAELHDFEGNQDLMKITKRAPHNDTYHISFINDTTDQPKEGVLEGSTLQLHSHDGEHRFYSVYIEEQGEVKENYLMLDVSVESALMGGCSIDVVHEVRLITIEELVLLHSPIMYDLS